jgi:hypothetical protein
VLLSMPSGEAMMPLERLPPRSALPRGITIEAAPGLGTTWYERSAAYWARRAAVTLAWVLLLMVMAAGAGALVAAFPPGSPGFRAALGGEIAWALVVVGWYAVQTARHWNDPRPWYRWPHSSGPWGYRQSPLGPAILLVLLSPLTIGLAVAWFLTWLLPVTPGERRARLRLAEALRTRGYPVPGGQADGAQ